MVTQHHAQTFGHRNQRSQMGVEEIGFAQPLALASREVVNDTGKTQGAERLATNFLAQIEEPPFAPIRRGNLLVRGGIVKTPDQRKRVDASAQGSKGGSVSLTV